MRVRAIEYLVVAVTGCLLIACETHESASDRADEDRAESMQNEQAGPGRGKSGGAASDDPKGRTGGGSTSGDHSSPPAPVSETEQYDNLPKTKFGYAKSLDSDQRDLPEVPEGDIEKEQYAPGKENLPQGVVYTDRGVGVEPGYPTEDDPHVYLGRVVFAGDTDEHFTHEMLAEFRKEVSRRGGNLMVWDIDDDSSEPPQAYVLRLSDAEPKVAELKAEETDPETLLAEEAETAQSNGYDEVVAKETRSLESFEPVEFEARRGKCYWITFALKPDASWNQDAREMLKIDASHPTEQIDNHAGQPEIEETDSDGNLTHAARSGHSEIPCPQTSGTLEYRLLTVTGRTGAREKTDRLGEGNVLVRVHARDVSEEKLRAKKRKHEKAKERLRKKRRRERLESCEECVPVKRECEGELTGCPDYVNCLGAEFVDFCREHGY